ncbi:hypothetical protein [Asticcacaulis sp.]|uniref:hypothetical protein n=1 Tax=Asticcacaulis sp. TaxID=1872648 RepID=UPI0026204BE2|nr:hypothetical protein [Asticcacaulis sp.]
MKRWVYILGILITGILCALSIPLDFFLKGLQLAGTALSIQIAAVFVRLNRGMPTLTWNKLEPNETEKLTSSIVNLTSEYIAIIFINAIVLLFGLALLVSDHSRLLWPNITQPLIVFLFTSLFALCWVRMGYVIWRDYDIVKLQKAIIDLSARREAEAEAKKEAEAVLKSIAEAGLAVEPRPAPKAWLEH